MHDQLYENANNLYTTVLLPLTEKDKLVIEKTIKNHYQINVLLLPLLVLIYFWGLVYFLIFLAVVLAYNISAFYSINKHEVSLNNQKLTWAANCSCPSCSLLRMWVILSSESVTIRTGQPSMMQCQ